MLEIKLPLASEVQWDFTYDPYADIYPDEFDIQYSDLDDGEDILIQCPDGEDRVFSLVREPTRAQDSDGRDLQPLGYMYESLDGWGLWLHRGD